MRCQLLSNAQIDQTCLTAEFLLANHMLFHAYSASRWDDVGHDNATQARGFVKVATFLRVCAQVTLGCSTTITTSNNLQPL